MESQDPRFNANLDPDKNLIWTRKFRCSQPIKPFKASLRNIFGCNANKILLKKY